MYFFICMKSRIHEMIIFCKERYQNYVYKSEISDLLHCFYVAVGNINFGIIFFYVYSYQFYPIRLTTMK